MARIPSQDRAAGFTLFELVVALAIVAILVGVFLHRFLTLQEIAERAAMEQTVVSMRAALAGRVALLAATGRRHEIGALAGSNPMDLLGRRPANDLGELDAPSAASAVPGHWYFDKDNRQLVYVAAGSGLSPDRAGLRRARFALKRTGPRVTNETDSVELSPVGPYEWVIK